jgi:hypothetical protein
MLSVHSIELWIRFLLFGLISIIHFRSPLTIQRSEKLGRELFSGHVKNDGITLRPNAFKINRKSENSISLDRISLSPIRLFTSLALTVAKRRRVNFKGFAEIDPDAFTRVRLEGDIVLSVKGDPTRSNPFHANVPLPPDRDDDFYLFVATELLQYAYQVRGIKGLLTTGTKERS